ncbi:MAG: AraC family transcriptional regulator [Rhizobiales bacterium]|nr:AraC family transcriptional regulator [Hyphomicrobiales bacterium]
MRRIRTIAQNYAAGGGWRLDEADVHPALSGLVLRYAGYEERGSRPITRCEWAVPHLPVIVNFGDAFAITDTTTGSFGSFAAGLYDRPVTVTSSGSARCLQFDLTPAGAQLFFGRPLGAMANRILSLEDVLGPAASRLVDELEAANSWTDRFDRLEKALLARIGMAKPAPGLVIHAWGLLQKSSGTAPIEAIAEKLGCSRKHLAASFREHIGLSPKTAARVIRFNAVLDGLRAKRAFADIAFHCGYADQAHMIRECRAFTGLAPRDFAAQFLRTGSA